MNISNALSAATQFSDLRPIVAQAQPYVTFWGQRRITVAGYRGSAPIGALETRVRELLAQKMFCINQEDRSDGTFITKQIKQLCTTANGITKTRNCFTQFLNSLFLDDYIFFRPFPSIALKMTDSESLPKLFKYTREYDDAFGDSSKIVFGDEIRYVPSSGERDSSSAARTPKASNTPRIKHENHCDPAQKNSPVYIQTALASSTKLADLCQVIIDAKVSMNFLRDDYIITAPSYHGSISYDDLTHRIQELVEINPHFNEEERLHGKFILERLHLLIFVCSIRERNKSELPLWFTMIRLFLDNALIGSEWCKRRMESDGIHEDVFTRYTKNQYNAAFNTTPSIENHSRAIREKSPKWDYERLYRYAAPKEAIST